MEWASADVIAVINYLLPGFLAAWVFYGLTAHPKADAFERVVQALIFTVVVKLLIVVPRKLWWMLWGRMATPEIYWTERHELGWSLVVAVLIGLTFAACANWNVPHRWLNDLKITKRTSYPSEWYSALHNAPRYLILHLQGGRRLKGWPEEWPDAPDKGHFVIQQPIWITNKGEEVRVEQTLKMVVPATQVEMIEMVRTFGEMTVDLATLAETQRPLFKLHEEREKAKQHGREDTSTTTSTDAAAPTSSDE